MPTLNRVGFLQIVLHEMGSLATQLGKENDPATISKLSYSHAAFCHDHDLANAALQLHRLAM